MTAPLHDIILDRGFGKLYARPQEVYDRPPFLLYLPSFFFSFFPRVLHVGPCMKKVDVCTVLGFCATDRLGLTGHGTPSTLETTGCMLGTLLRVHTRERAP